MRFWQRAELRTHRAFLWGATISILLLVGPPLTSAQSKFVTHNPSASVALIAQIPESVSLAGRFQSAPVFVQENGVRASILVLESAWHLAMGHSVSASAQLDAASERNQTASLIRLRRAGDPLDAWDIPAFGFLARPAPTRVSLLDSLDPRLGRQTQINGLLILHVDAPAPQPQVVIITVTAL